MTDTAGTASGYIAFSTAAGLAFLSIISHNKNSCSYIIWHYISWVQFFQWTALINSSSPSNYLLFFKNFNQASSFSQIISYHYTSHVPTRYSELGVKYNYFINNAEKALMVWCACLVCYVLFIFLGCNFAKNARKIICDNLILRATLLCFLEFSIFASLQIFNFEISTWYGITNSVVSVAIIACEAVMIGYLPIAANLRYEGGIEEEISRISTVIEEFNFSENKCRYYYIFFMIERISAAASYAFLSSYPAMQALVLACTLFATSNI